MNQLSQNHKIGILIPTRGNRPEFLKQSLLMLGRQTMKADFVEVVEYKPDSDDFDITQRYHFGCDRLFSRPWRQCDLVIFWEDDEWYAPNYIEKMYTGWIEAGCPSIWGIGYSIYYHIIGSMWFKINHPSRASMMATCVTSEVMKIKWPADNYPYTDVILWERMKGKTMMPAKPICLGIKHGIGMVGGGAHNVECGHYSNQDFNGEFLKSITGPDYLFYHHMKINFAGTN